MLKFLIEPVHMSRFDFYGLLLMINLIVIFDWPWWIIIPTFIVGSIISAIMKELHK